MERTTSTAAVILLSLLVGCHCQVRQPLLDEQVVSDSLNAGATREYTFTVHDSQHSVPKTPTTIQPDLIRLMVSPCNGGNTLKWQVLHEGELEYEFNPEDPANNNNIQDNRMVALGKRRKRQLQNAGPETLPNGFQYELSQPDEFTGLGTALKPETGLYVKPDASSGPYTLRITNTASQPIEYTAFLARREKQPIIPELPEVQNVKVDKLRPTSAQISWRPVNGAGVANSGIDYTVHAFPVSTLQAGENINSACGVKRTTTRLSTSSSAGPKIPASFSTQGTTSAMFNDLQPGTRYRLNVLAMNATSRRDVAYLGVEITTSPQGTTLRQEQDLNNITLPPNSKQIFTLDLVDRQLSSNPAQNPLGVTVFPCNGLVTWSMTKDGIEQQAFETSSLGSDDAGGEISDSDGDSGSDDDRKRRQINNDAEEEEKDEPDTPDQNDNKDKLQSQRVLPLPKGVGKNAKTGGQTVFTYNEKMREPGLYQLTVYNTEARPLSFDLYASTKPALERPFPVLPADPQVKAVDVTGTTAEIGWLPSQSNDPLAYCISATPRSQLSPQYVQSSPCGLRRAPVYNQPPPLPSIPSPNFGNPGLGLGAPGQQGLGSNFPNAQATEAPVNPRFRQSPGAAQAPGNIISLPGADMSPAFSHSLAYDQFPAELRPLVQRTRGCGIDTRGNLSALSAGTEYNVEVLAINMKTKRPLAYTSALVRTSGSQTLSAGFSMCLFTALVTLFFALM